MMGSAINPFGAFSEPVKKRTKCPPAMKNKIRKRWWGADKYEGTCFCCGEKLIFQNAECGRIKAGAFGGKYTPENARLICKECNGSMGKTNMKIYMKRTYPERSKRYFPKDEQIKKEKSGQRIKKIKIEETIYGVRYKI